MNLKKIFIYEYDILFDILNEIKEKFNLDIIKADKIKYSQLKNDISNDYLIISGTKQTEMRNHLVIDKKPLKIEKLLELINLKFLKENFNSKSNVIVGSYKININSRKISQNDVSIDLTEREINLILFLNNSKSKRKPPYSTNFLIFTLKKINI